MKQFVETPKAADSVALHCLDQVKAAVFQGSVENLEQAQWRIRGTPAFPGAAIDIPDDELVRLVTIHRDTLGLGFDQVPVERDQLDPLGDRIINSIGRERALITLGELERFMEAHGLHLSQMRDFNPYDAEKVLETHTEHDGEVYVYESSEKVGEHVEIHRTHIGGLGVLYFVKSRECP